MNSRIPPHNDEAEQNIITVCLMSEQAVAQCVDELSDEFYIDKNQHIFNAIKKLFQSSKTVGPATIMNQMQEDGIYFDAVYLASIMGGIASQRSLPDYIKIVKDKAKARGIIEMARKAEADCYDNRPTDDVMSDIGTEFFRINSENVKTQESVETVAIDALNQIEERYKNKQSLIGLDTGFSGINRRIHGLCAPDFIIVGGRPGMGKTTLALNMMQSAAVKGAKCIYFSLEMDRKQLAMKMISTFSGVNFSDILHGRIKDGDWPKLTRASAKLSSLPIIIDDGAGINVFQIIARAKTHAIKYGLDCVFVDHIGLMSSPNFVFPKDVLTEITLNLKRLAKDLNIPVVGLSQLNRSLENRDDKRPRMSDVRDSGTIEQDADIVMFVYRDEVYNKSEDNPDKGIAEIISAKVRMGNPGTDRLLFQGEFQRFQNLTF